MIRINNNISPLPFYDDIAMQNHRKSYAFGQVYPLVMPVGIILPFQFILPGLTIPVPVTVALHNMSTGAVTVITQSLSDNGFTTSKITNGMLVKYPGQLPIKEITLEGRYYLSISFGILRTVYSEVFTMTNNLDGYVSIEYSNPYDFVTADGVISFSDNFKFKCYVCTQIGKPEYTFEEEATERMGYSFIESQVSKKVYRFVFLAPEFLCDALRIVRLCSTKTITEGENVYKALTFNIDPKWEEQGDLASVEAEFETDTVIANLGGYTTAPGPFDFNSDFNNDFNT